jgi:hypothetical protein
MPSNILRTPASGALLRDDGTKIIKGGGGKIHTDDKSKILRD